MSSPYLIQEITTINGGIVSGIPNYLTAGAAGTIVVSDGTNWTVGPSVLATLPGGDWVGTICGETTWYDVLDIGTDSVWQSTPWRITMPSAGVYLLMADVPCAVNYDISASLVAVTAQMAARFYDETAGAAVPNSSRPLAYSAAQLTGVTVGGGGTIPLALLYTIPALATVRIEGFRLLTGAGAAWNYARMGGGIGPAGSDSRLALRYIKLANLPTPYLPIHEGVDELWMPWLAARQRIAWKPVVFREDEVFHPVLLDEDGASFNLARRVATTKLERWGWGRHGGGGSGAADGSGVGDGGGGGGDGIELWSWGGVWIALGTSQGSGSSLTVSGVSAVAGDVIVVSTANYPGGAGAVTGITVDGNAMSLAFDTPNPTTTELKVWYYKATGTLTNVATMATVNPTCNAAMTVSKVGGLAMGALDKSHSGTGTSDAPTSGASGTTTLADEFILGAVATGGPGSDSAGNWTGFANGQRTGTTSGTNDVTISEGYKFVSATGSYTATKTDEVSHPWAAGVATFD